MKIIAFGASTSSTSINQTLASYAAHLLAKTIDGAEVTVLDLNQFVVPIFSEDTEREIGQAIGAKEFLNQLAQADALVISFAEHNGSYTAAFKNLFDWTSRIDPKVFQDKPAVYLATSPGPGGAKNVLVTATTSARFFGSDVKASLSVPSFYDSFDLATGQFKDVALAKQVQQAVEQLR